MFGLAHTDCTRGLDRTRVLLANEPRTYREALLEALRWRRPKLEVDVTEGSTLDAEVKRLHPHLVVCSRGCERLRDGVLAWIKLYPDDENLAEIFTAGGRATIVGFRFGDFLSVVDGMAFLRRPAEGGGSRA